MQQHLPPAVLKLATMVDKNGQPIVATTPTACGIETHTNCPALFVLFNMVATTPTACGIETEFKYLNWVMKFHCVATTPTACGIETYGRRNKSKTFLS